MSWAAALIDYLDAHAGAFTGLLTAVLIGVTAYYALQNRRMVKEMAKARELTILPKLALAPHRIAPVVWTVAVKNVGPGAALDLDVRLRFEPIDEENNEADERRWRHTVLASGEQRDFIPPGALEGNLNALPATYKTIRLVGTMKDAVGKRHPVDETFADLPEWREVLGGSRQRWTAADPERRLAEELVKKLDKPVARLASPLETIAQAAYDLRQPPREDLDPPE